MQAVTVTSLAQQVSLPGACDGACRRVMYDARPMDRAVRVAGDSCGGHTKGADRATGRRGCRGWACRVDRIAIYKEAASCNELKGDVRVVSLGEHSAEIAV